MKRLIFLLLPLILLNLSCTQTKITMTPEDSPNKLDFEYGSEGLKGQVKAVDYVLDNSVKPIRVQITLYSKADHDVTFEYKFIWFDAKKMLIDSSAHTWTPLTIAPKEEKYIKGVGPALNANDSRLRVRYIKGI